MHQPTGRTLDYGALVPAAAKLSVPKGESLRFKDRAAWKFVGQDTSTYDQKDIVTGKAQFGLDVFREGMVHASIEHPPVLGGTVRSVDDAAAKKVRGVQQTVTLDTFKPPHGFQALGGVAVIGDNTWAVLKGRRALKVEWSDGPNATFASEPYKKSLLATVAKTGKVFRNHGNVDAEFAKGGKVVEASYYTPMAAHASMEPPAAVAEVQGDRAILWTPTQNPQAVQDTVAAALGIDKKNVEVHVTLLGGGFGRKSKPDYCAEAAVLARKLGKPVKVIWTREDDLRFDYYHSTAAVYHKAVVDGRGKPTAWLQRSAFPPIASTFAAGAREPMGFELDLGLTDLPYDIANIRAENGPADAHVRIGWFRSVCNVFHAFAAHSFADELAQAARRDSLEFMLEMLGPGKVLDLKAPGRELLELRRAVRQVSDRHEAAAPRAGACRREVGLGEAQVGRWAGVRRRRAPQLQYLCRLGGRGRSRCQGHGEGPGRAHGRRCRRHREPGSRPRPDGGISRDGDRVRPFGGDHRARGTHPAGQLPPVPGRPDERRSRPGARAPGREQRAADGRRRTRRAAGDPGVHERHLRRDGQARARAAVVENEAGVGAVKIRGFRL